ncbi:exonuclease SbcD [Arcanobacterium wilhelmae]|uniref:Nuclease SbcCD subunit D n=1 Tax=Arcanobacterium wilhelmae TaxID=1803177 RepID=A0ABT9N9Z5_9ACTO|nr:exonuclease SbcCD subunit D [Arcanobacterium wilhelmae]MDP9800534.1 exonuclease SbcD [Arcanobacterium wilhelmae]WFN89950.1 exonuclease SbcCD subunit D C-terminal domain-containing protein [Arcanobacterium wilhelmae]
MKILHTSDWHLGRTLHGADLTCAFETWCDHVVRLADEVDAVLISGDVFDRGVPPVAMVSLLSRTLHELVARTQVVITSGNHDSARRLGFASDLLKEGLTMRTRSADAGVPIPLKDSDGNVGAIVYGIPYLEPDIARVELAEGEELLDRSHEAVIRAALGRIRKDIESGEYAGLDVPRIVMAHAFIVGGEPSESERDLHIGGVDSAPSRIFDLGLDLPGGGVDYVALGHLHGPQKVGGDAPMMRYSGSPVAFSFSEEHHKKSSTIVDFENRHAPQVRLVPAPVERPLVTLRGTFEELTSGEHAMEAGAYVRAFVTDDSRPNNLVARMTKVFPYLLECQHTPASRTQRRATIEAVKNDPVTVIGDFFDAAGGRPITDEERALLTKAWEAVAKENEK